MNEILLHTTKQYYLAVSQASFSGQRPAFIRVLKHVQVREYHMIRIIQDFYIHISIMYNYIDVKKFKYENPLTDVKNRPEKNIEKIFEKNYGNLCPSAGVK